MPVHHEAPSARPDTGDFLTSKTDTPSLETDDPIAALDHKSIAIRAAACRDLTQMARDEHLDRLAHSARTDQSPAERLGTVAAASDILSRRRLDPSEDALSEAERPPFSTSSSASTLPRIRACSRSLERST